jgi:riboflavin synthase
VKEGAVVGRPLRVRRESLLRIPRPAFLLLQHATARRLRLYRTPLNGVRESRSYFVLMFTGIVRERGSVVSFDGSRLVVAAGTEAEIGDSVAIAGVCLTVAERGGGTLSFDVVGETVERSTLGRLAAGDEVNVEPALRAGEPMGGHIVQGHVDSVGKLRGGADGLTWFDAPPELLRYCVEKGSVAVDGTSLTVAALDDGGFAVALVPHTLEATTLGALDPGDTVNLEADVIAKYVERLTMTR